MVKAKAVITFVQISNVLHVTLSRTPFASGNKVHMQRGWRRRFMCKSLAGWNFWFRCNTAAVFYRQLMFSFQVQMAPSAVQKSNRNLSCIKCVCVESYQRRMHPLSALCSCFLQCSDKPISQTQRTCCDDPPRQRRISIVFIAGVHIVILSDAVSWLSCYRARRSPLEEITKTEWAVCQLYPPSKRTFGACYWVAPEQKWTSLRLRGGTERRPPLWFATVGEAGRGGR